MSKIFKIRRGTKAEVEAFPIPLSELIHAYDTDEVYLGGNSGNKKLPSRAEFESQAINVLYPPVGETALAANDVTDDGALLNDLLTSLGSGTYFFPEGTYRIETSVQVSSDNVTLVFHENAKIHVVGNVTAINLNNKYGKIYGGEIYSDGQTVGNGYYGIRVAGDFCTVVGTEVHDITYTAVMNSGKFNTFYDIVATDVGWDCGSNFLGTYAKWYNCKAFNTRRHGFSTDSNSHHIEFHNCYVENVGDPSMNEGQDAYHFEGSDYGKVINCQAVWNGDSNYIGQTAVAGNYMKVMRNEDSKDIIIDGLDVVIEASFTPTTPQDIYALYQNNPTGQYLTKINNYHFRNESLLDASGYMGRGDMELTNCIFEGRLELTQPSGAGYLKKMVNCKVIGEASDKRTFFTPQYNLTNAIIKGNYFENVDYAINGGQLVDCKIENNVFKNSLHSVRFGYDVSNSTKKSTRNTFRGNILDGVDVCINANWLQSEKTNIIEENTFKGLATTVFDVGTSPSTLLWKNNKADASFTTTNYVVGSGLTIDTDLTSEYDVVRNTVVEGAANPDTSGADLATVETELNEVKQALRDAGIIAN